jgi:SAM-dependent methyltransferase
MMSGLPPQPAILDMGCGPGMQSLELARLGARVTALDLHARFLAELERRAAAAGLADRITTVCASMADPPVEAGAFDAVWSEGAIYLIGFEAGLRAWTSLVKPGGYIAVSEAVFFQAPAATPERVMAAFSDYPAMTTIEGALERVRRVGLDLVGDFTLPKSAWWDHYYGPIAARLPTLRAARGGDPAYARRIAEAEAEIADYRLYSDYYGYQFIVMRRP